MRGPITRAFPIKVYRATTPAEWPCDKSRHNPSPGAYGLCDSREPFCGVIHMAQMSSCIVLIPRYPSVCPFKALPCHHCPFFFPPRLWLFRQASMHYTVNHKQCRYVYPSGHRVIQTKWTTGCIVQSSALWEYFLSPMPIDTPIWHMM